MDLSSPPDEPRGRIGIFGGAFDPPHVGHLIAAQDVAEALGLDRILLVPTGEPPRPKGRALAPARVRLRMVRAAIESDPRLAVSELELERDGPSFTVDTLRQLRDLQGVREPFLLMGADQWRSIGKWKEPEALVRMSRVVVMTREGEGAGAREETAGTPVCLPHLEVPVTRIDLTSSSIRERVRSGHSIRHLVPEAVRAVIEECGLYLSNCEES